MKSEPEAHLAEIWTKDRILPASRIICLRVVRSRVGKGPSAVKRFTKQGEQKFGNTEECCPQLTIVVKLARLGFQTHNVQVAAESLFTFKTFIYTTCSDFLRDVNV
ncbi:hypothetical protein R1flu_009663 [Riccia fluitans]|uniref:Uncharacterized protein n=1 Tax=Riccia fluitans TaxID=41844 RepID=A0ABD1Z348_9MARC